MDENEDFRLDDEIGQVSEINQWRQMSVTIRIKNRFERQLKELQAKHNDYEYKDLKEVELNQIRLQLLDRFLKNIFAIEKVAIHKTEQQ